MPNPSQSGALVKFERCLGQAKGVGRGEECPGVGTAGSQTPEPRTESIHPGVSPRGGRLVQPKI